MTTKHRRLSISTWSLHRPLGQPPGYSVEMGQTGPTEGHNQGDFTLLELPSRIAAFGIKTLEICHFHLPSRDRAYLDDLKAAIDEAGVELYSFLIDAGDISDPIHAERDSAWSCDWFEVAATLGAQRVRVSAGKQSPSDAALQRSLTHMGDLAREAKQSGLRLMTENWHALLATPAQVTHLLDSLEGQVGLCLDFGNWRGEEKYAHFETIVPYAESCHAKAFFNEDGTLDRDDYVRCLEITKSADFTGPYTLIFESAVLDNWAGLGLEKEIVEGYL